jgi:hypothetical protein
MKKKKTDKVKPPVKAKGKGKEKEQPVSGVKDAVVGEKRKRDDLDEAESTRPERKTSDPQQDEPKRKKKRKRKASESIPVVLS